MFTSLWDYYAPDAVDKAIAAMDRAIACGCRLETALNLAVETYIREAGSPPSHLRGYLHATWRKRRRQKLGG